MPPKTVKKNVNPEEWKAVGASVEDPACHNCKFYSQRKELPYGVCGVDLPPFVLRSNDPKHYRVNQNYLCRLWSRKET